MRPPTHKRDHGQVSAPGLLLLSLLAAVALAVLADCSSSGPEPIAPDDATVSPPMTHGQPNEAAGQMCVVCHTCGHDGTATARAPIIDRTHAVCESCHHPDGSVKAHSAEGGCEWEMDCDANPPIVNCDDCHTVQYVNDLCEACH